MTPAAEVVAAARAYIDVPFRHQGRSRKEGLDCAGLLIRVAHDLGLTKFDIRGYKRLPDDDALAALCDEHLVRTFGFHVGGVARIRMDGDARPRHLAIMAEQVYGPTIIHSTWRFGKVVEHRLDDEMRRRIVARYLIPGVEY